MITEYGPSATALAISRPRFSGPGWRMMTCGFASRTASSVRQKYCEYSSSVGKKLAPCRSRWMRSIITTSASRTPAASSVWSSAPKAARSRGTSVGGPTRRTVDPSARSACRFERATRLCRMSPTIATVSPSRRPRCSRIVSRSRRACVGCSWQPSPALRIGHETCRASRWHAPEAG